MPQVIITLVIEHYRIQQGQIERISNYGALTISFSVLGMLYINLKHVRADVLLRRNARRNRQIEKGEPSMDTGWFRPVLFRFVSSSLDNLVPCIITACVLFA